MWNLPTEHSLYATSSYTSIFMYTLLWNFGIFGMCAFGTFLVLFPLKLYCLKRRETWGIERQSLIAREYKEINKSENSSQVHISNSEQQMNSQNRKFKLTLFDVVNFITSLAFYFTLLCIVAQFLTINAFGQLGYGTAKDILAMICVMGTVTLPTIIWKFATKSKPIRSMKKELIFTIIILLLWAGLSRFLIIASKGACHCIFNNKYGSKIQGDYQISTQFTRSLYLNKVCPDGKVCHIYATLAENASESVFINVHTGININNITVLLETLSQYGQTSDQVFAATNNKPFQMHDIEYIGQRNVFSLYFNNLKSDTLYSVSVKNTATNELLKATKYRTLPNQNGEQLRLAVGGDIGINQKAQTLTMNLIQYNPHVLMIGGDIAYDDANTRNCFYSWDTVYDLFNGLNQKLDRLVPLIFSIGNHDVGYHALASVKIDFNKIQEIPLFFTFNPQHTLSGRNQVPDVKQRLSFHYHILGPTVHAHLDSGYIEAYDRQKMFLQKIIDNFPALYKFANYHNPIYPSCTDSTEGSNDRAMIEKGLKYWAPAFDSGRFVAAFEHHTHFKKFTHKIKGDKVSKDDGVRYVGDGSWGVPQFKCPQNHLTPRSDYFQYYENNHANHIWKVRIFKNGNSNYSIQYKAINIKNEIDFYFREELSL